MDETKDADDDIDGVKLLFIGSNKEKFNFNTFRMALNFLSDIDNAKTSLNKAEFDQKDLEKKLEELQFNYKPKNKKEKEEKDAVLMQAKELLESRNKIINAFKDGTFRSEHLKESDDDDDAYIYIYVLKDVNKFINEIRSMEEKIDLDLFEEFFEILSPAEYLKVLINTKNRDENKEKVKEIEYIISDLKEKI